MQRPAWRSMKPLRSGAEQQEMMSFLVFIGAVDVLISLVYTSVLLRRGIRNVHSIEWLVLSSFMIPGLLLVSPAVIAPGLFLSVLRAVLALAMLIVVVLAVRALIRLRKQAADMQDNSTQ